MPNVQTLMRRLRGVVGTTIATSIPWTALGFLCGLAFHFQLIPDITAFAQPGFPGGIVGALTVTGAVVGTINGLVFSGLLFAGERGKTVDDLSAWRFAGWGALATAATLGVPFSSPIAAGIGAVLGAGAAVATLVTARRGRLTTAASPSLNP
jgi:hypothetical protein